MRGCENMLLKAETTWLLCGQAGREWASVCLLNPYPAVRPGDKEKLLPVLSCSPMGCHLVYVPAVGPGDTPWLCRDSPDL